VSVIISGGGKTLNSLQWKIIFIYLMLILFSLQLISVYLVQSLEQYYLRNYKESLENQARLLSAFMGPGFGESEEWVEGTVRLARELQDLQEMEVVILDSFAHIIGTSGSQTLLGRRLIRDEITRALAGHSSDNVRFDPANLERRYYLAVPIVNEGNTIGVIYLSGSLKAVDDTLDEVKTILLTGVGLALAVSFLLGIVLTRTITTPIKEVTDQAYLMARGDFTRKIEVQTADEIGLLGETFNYLAEQLSLTINEISSEKSKVEAIIKNMSDGIVALDGNGHLIQVNPSARRLLNNLRFKVPALGHSGFNLLRNLIGSDSMRQFIRQQKALTAEIASNAPVHIMQIKIAPFKVDKGKLEGTLIVLHDITRERELTRRQEEFVADVSHELRTPLSTVKSYVETLLDGAAEESVVRTRFLNVLARETDRMVIMVKDLLVLSQMDSSQILWDKSAVDLKELAMEAAEQLKQKFSTRLPNIEVVIDSGFPPAYADRDKVIMVFSNIMSNAAKYTNPEGSITVSATVEDEFLRITIEDTGSGIPENEQPKVFERFYRVEKTRSRDYGGTGLGLSIARKVVESHGGIIGIESAMDVGTKVYFTLPRFSREEGTSA
jgi:two-component system, OmpR family, sensor histidine kinase VicK